MRGTVLIGGIGNVLLGDDQVGPYIVHLLESQYRLGESVEIADLGTPALDLTHRIVGLDAVILVDCVDSAEHPPGTVLLYRKADVLRIEPAQRLDPHSPALSECLMTADMLGASPRELLLVGIAGECFDPGRPLSQSVQQGARNAIEAVLAELERLGVDYEQRETVEPPVWWAGTSPSEAANRSNL